MARRFFNGYLGAGYNISETSKEFRWQKLIQLDKSSSGFNYVDNEDYNYPELGKMWHYFNRKDSATGTILGPQQFQIRNKKNINFNTAPNSKSQANTDNQKSPIIYQDDKEIYAVSEYGNQGVRGGDTYARYVVRKTGNQLNYNPSTSDSYFSYGLPGSINWVLSLLDKRPDSKTLSIIEKKAEELKDPSYKLKLKSALQALVKQQFDNLIQTVNSLNPKEPLNIKNEDDFKQAMQSVDEKTLWKSLFLRSTGKDLSLGYTLYIGLPYKAAYYGERNNQLIHGIPDYTSSNELIIGLFPAWANLGEYAAGRATSSVNDVQFLSPWLLISLNLDDLSTVKDLFQPGTINFKSKIYTVNLPDLKLNVCCDFKGYSKDNTKAIFKYSVFSSEPSLIAKMAYTENGKRVEKTFKQLQQITSDGKSGIGITVDPYEYDFSTAPNVEIYLKNKNDKGETINYNISPKQEEGEFTKINVIVSCIQAKKPEIPPPPLTEITPADFDIGCQLISQNNGTSTIKLYVYPSLNAKKLLSDTKVAFSQTGRSVPSFSDTPREPMLISAPDTYGNQTTYTTTAGIFEKKLEVNSKLWTAIPDKYITVRFSEEIAKKLNYKVSGATKFQDGWYYFTKAIDCGVKYKEPEKTFTPPPPPEGTKIKCSDLLNSVQCIEISKEGNKKGDKVKLAAYVTLTPLGEQLLHNFNEVLNPSQFGPDSKAITEKKLPLPITKAGQLLGYGYVVYAEFKIGDILPKNAYVNAIFRTPDPNYQSFKYDLSALQGPVKSASFPNDVFYFCSVSLDCLERMASEYKEEATPPPSKPPEQPVTPKPKPKEKRIDSHSTCIYVTKNADGSYKFRYYNYFLDEDLKYISHVIIKGVGPNKSDVKIEKANFISIKSKAQNKTFKGFMTEYNYKFQNPKSTKFMPNTSVEVYIDSQYASEYKFYNAKGNKKEYFKLSSDKKYLVGLYKRDYQCVIKKAVTEKPKTPEKKEEPKVVITPTPTPVITTKPQMPVDVIPTPTPVQTTISPQPCPPCPTYEQGKQPVDVVPSNISPIQVPIQFKPDGGAMEVPIKFKPMSISELPVSPMDTVKQTPACIIVIKKHQGTYKLPPNCPFDRRRSCFRVPGNRALYAKPERKRKNMPDININVIANTGDMRRKYDKKPYFNINSQNRRDASRYAPYYNQPQYDKYGRRQRPLTIKDREGRQLPSTYSIPEGLKQVADVQQTNVAPTQTQPAPKKGNKGFWILIAIVGVIAAGAFADGNLFEDFTKTIGKAKKSKW